MVEASRQGSAAPCASLRGAFITEYVCSSSFLRQGSFHARATPWCTATRLVRWRAARLTQILPWTALNGRRCRAAGTLCRVISCAFFSLHLCSYFACDATTFGVAAFHARHVAPEEDDAERRGARTVSVGLILTCSEDPGDRLRLMLLHLARLEALASDIAGSAPHEIVAAYVQEHAASHDKAVAAEPGSLDLEEELEASAQRLAYDPVTHLFSVHRFLGPLLIPLVKTLLLPRRILLYCPAPVERAGLIGFNLAEIVHAAFVHADAVPGAVRLRGMVTLHDLDVLQREAGADVTHASIAWTSDRILLDKTDIYDVCLDVSAFATEAPPARPLARVVSRASLEPRALAWTTRDLSLYLELAEQERRYEVILSENERPAFDAWCTQDRDPPAAPRVVPAPRWMYAQQDARCVVLGYVVLWLAYVRFWLTEWWLLRSQLHVLLPLSLVVPLGVRSEVGVSSSVVDFPDAEDEPEEPEVDGTPTKTGDAETLRCRTSAMLTTDDLRDAAAPRAGVDESESDDPFIAACGLSARPAHAWQRSTSRASVSSRAASYLPAALAWSERTIIPAHPRFEPRDAPCLPLEIMSSLYLFTLWSSYVRSMYKLASDYVAARADEQPASAIVVPRGVLGEFGFDAYSELDCALLAIMAQERGCAQRVQRGWFW